MPPGAALSTGPAPATGATGSWPSCTPGSCSWPARVDPCRCIATPAAAGPEPGTGCKAVRDLVWTLAWGALASSAWERAECASPETVLVIDRFRRIRLLGPNCEIDRSAQRSISQRHPTVTTVTKCLVKIESQPQRVHRYQQSTHATRGVYHHDRLRPTDEH